MSETAILHYLKTGDTSSNSCVRRPDSHQLLMILFSVAPKRRWCSGNASSDDEHVTCMRTLERQLSFMLLPSMQNDKYMILTLYHYCKLKNARFLGQERNAVLGAGGNLQMNY